MRHTLIAAALALAVTGAGYAALSRNGDAPSAASAGLLLSDLAVSPVSAAEVDRAEIRMAASHATVLVDGPDAAATYAVGGSSRTSMVVSEQQKAEIRRQIALFGPGETARASLRGLAVGATLPRASARLARLPSRIVEIVPNYGAYEHLVTDTGALVIVDPRDYRIIDII